jgi:hypothetical protein
MGADSVSVAAKRAIPGWQRMGDEIEKAESEKSGLIQAKAL